MTFNEWMKRTRHTIRSAGEALGLSREVVNHLQRGTREPTLKTAMRIEYLTSAHTPRTVVRAWEMLSPASRIAVYGEKGRP